MKKIVILGGTGFIGQYIVDELLESGYFVKMINRNEDPNIYINND